MRRLLLIMLLPVLVLAACGRPTDNTASAPNQSPRGSEATTASPEAVPAEGETQTTAADPVERNDKYDAPPEMMIDPNKTYTATIETTKGTMKAELYPQEAPMAVNNFVFLARENFYEGIKFHRIMKDFMVQTGDPLGNGTGGPGYTFAEEPVTREYTRGTLAMARTQAPNSQGSQFFIVHQDYPLPPEYTIFGKVTEGLDVLDAIANTPVTTNPMSGEPSVPTEDVRITNITIQEQ